MKQKLLLFAFTIISTMLFSQTVPMAFEDWKTTDGTQNFFYKTVSKTDRYGNIFIAGATMNAGTTDILVAKYNSSGNQLWIQQLAGAATGGIDFAAGLAVTDTYVYLTGAISNNTTTPETDCVTMKLATSNGSVVWSSTYDGGTAHDAGKHIVVDGSGNVYITGASYNASYNTDFITIKYNSSGTQQWVSRYDYLGFDDGAIKVVTSGSNLTVTGAVTTATANVYKLATLTYAQSSGSLIATSVATAVTTSSVDVVTDLTTDASGNIIIIGSTAVSGQANNMYVQKLVGSTLASTWIYTYNGVANLDDITKAVVADASGNVYISGYSTSLTTGKNITLIKLNSSGVNQWTQTTSFAGDDEAVDLVIDASSNLYLTGYKYNSTVGNKNYYTAKYNSSGTLIWEVETDGFSYNDNATNLCIDSLNNVIVTGQVERGINDYRFLTVKYVQADIKNPVDLLSQPTNKNFGYHQNRGQVRNDTGGTAPSALFYTHNQYPKIYIEKNSYNYVYTKTDTVLSSNDTIERINVGFSGANANVRPYGYNPKTYPLHYFLGQVGEPITEVTGCDRIVTQNIYPNIDLHYYSNSKGLKYYFVVKEGGNPRDIKFRIDGAISTTVTSNNLFINGVVDDITLQRPYAYMVNGSNVTTTLSAVSWVNIGGNDYEFSVPTYTTSQTLIYVVETVKPASVTSSTQDIEYSTYYGKGNNDIFNDIKVTSNGDHYVVGNTDGIAFPTQFGLYTYKGFTDAVVLRFEVTKDSCAFATFYGGAGAEYGNSVDVNSFGEIFIAGRTNSSGSSGIPTFTTSGASGQPNNGMSIAPSGADPNDGFFARFAPNGNGHTWGRYYGGSQEDGINSIFIDNSNNLHFTGYARSNNITMVSAAQPYISTSGGANTDAILGKFSSTLSQVFSTYLGGGGSPFLATRDEGRDITIDGSGNVIVVGTTDASNFPVSNSTGNSNTFYDGTFGGARDGFIARYSSTGSKQFASYFGGADTYGIDEITRVNYNSVKDEIYFAGQSNDTISFPYVALAGGFNLHRKATNAAFIASMTGNLTKQWCTNYGKAASNFSVTGLASDNAGIIYLTGQAKSNTLTYPANTPTLTVYKDTIRNADDGFVTIFNPQKNLFHAHYLGGTGNDYINNAYVGTNNKLYVVGNTGSSANDFPIAYNSVNIQNIDSTFGGGQNDGFITRFDMSTIQIISVKEISEDDFMLNVYPNPSTNGFILDMKNDELKNIQAKVYNITGQLVVEQKITQPLTKFYCETWANGVYLINVNANGKLKTFKLIKN